MKTQVSAIILEGKKLGMSDESINAAIEIADEMVVEGASVKQATVAALASFVQPPQPPEYQKHLTFGSWLSEQNTRLKQQNNIEDLRSAWEGAVNACMSIFENEPKIRKRIESLLVDQKDTSQ